MGKGEEIGTDNIFTMPIMHTEKTVSRSTDTIGTDKTGITQIITTVEILIIVIEEIDILNLTITTVHIIDN